MDGVLNPGAERSARVRGAVTRHLSNAVATWQGGEPFGVLFDVKALQALDSVVESQVTCRCSIDSVPGLDQGDVLHIDGKAWTVLEPVIADSTGWVTLHLRVGDD